ncbi:MAG: RIP metalloprotease RseP [Deltaproteobacteria bacterium]|nr:RIP metalloprotease RseP [Deltaproteobacteria bacterium]
MTTVISFLIVLGVLIFIHELGHFAVAKAAGVGVEKFSLGFGPKIISVRRGETEYRISAVPFGGYVKMVGESPDEDVAEEDKKKSFAAKPISIRSLIVAAGSVMNLVLALVLFPLIFMLGIKVPAYFEGPPEVGYVSHGSAAEKAGIRRGDTVEEVNGERVEGWEGIYKATALNAEGPLRLLILREGERTDVVVNPPAGDGYGFYPPMPPVIGGLSKGFPAEKAGLKPGDRIKAVDGQPISHWVELQEVIKSSGRERTFLVERDGRSFEAKITAVWNSEMKSYLVGVMQVEETVIRSYGFFESVGLGVKKAGELVILLFAVIKGLFSGAYSVKTLGGPIMIAQVAGRAAESGAVELMSIIAFLSLQIGIINLFPIPVLDGGHLFFFLIERIKGKPVSEKILGISQQVGMALLIALMVFVTWNDVLRLFR